MPKNYVNNAEFLKAIIDYKEACAQAKDSDLSPPQIPNYIGDCILQISRRLSSKPNFSGYSYKEEMISDGLENAIQALGNFDPSKSKNPFAYFTQIIWFAFLRRIEKEKKQLYIKHKVAEHSIITDSIVEHNDNDQFDTSNHEFSNEYMDDFVKSYEKKIEDKRKTQSKVRTSSKNLSDFIEDGDEA